MKQPIAGSTTPRHVAVRGGGVEVWLKDCRDSFQLNSQPWEVLDDLLNDYRLAADTGDTLPHRSRYNPDPF